MISKIVLGPLQSESLPLSIIKRAQLIEYSWKDFVDRGPNGIFDLLIRKP